MELFIPHTPLAIVITAFLALVVCFKIAKDAKEIRSSHQAHSLIMHFVKKKNIPRVAVVIELRKTADTILPLLDHLYEQNYKGLEIVIMVKHTAGKFAQSKLMYYRRKYQRNGMKIVKHSKGMNMTALIRRYVSSPFVMQLQSQNTLSEDFFSKLAIDLLEEFVDVIIPRRHVAAGKTVLSAVRAAFSVWQHVFAVFHTPKVSENNLTVGRVYRRKTLLNDAKPSTIYTPRIAVHEGAEMSWKMTLKSATAIIARSLQSGRVRIVFASAVLILGGLMAYIWNEDTLLLAEFVIGLYSIVYGLSLLGLKGYPFWQRINLLLFAPFSLAFTILLVIYSVIALLYNWSGLRKLSLRELVVRGRRRSLATPKL